jgi:hypothetical protein
MHTLLLLLFQLLFISPGNSQEDVVQLHFNIHQDRDVYDQSDYDEPPQFAIWLENLETKMVRTVFVTYRTGTGNFEGKVECPVSLPVWIGVFRRETGRNDFPRPWKPFYDGITGATPKIKEFTVSTTVEKGIKCHYYIEMNVAGDYNESFPAVLKTKRPDDHGNGQPSIIYRGVIKADKGQSSTPIIIGRSDQFYFKTEINSDLAGIDTARDVFSDVNVTCN